MTESSQGSKTGEAELLLICVLDLFADKVLLLTDFTSSTVKTNRNIATHKTIIINSQIVIHFFDIALYLSMSGLFDTFLYRTHHEQQ